MKPTSGLSEREPHSFSTSRPIRYMPGSVGVNVTIVLSVPISSGAAVLERIQDQLRPTMPPLRVFALEKTELSVTGWPTSAVHCGGSMIAVGCGQEAVA